MIIIDKRTMETGTFASLKPPQKFGTSQCVFEYVYFARSRGCLANTLPRFAANLDGS
jgi:glutamine phosphoribosylpyrophosphate amidotransferase